MYPNMQKERGQAWFWCKFSEVEKLLQCKPSMQPDQDLSAFTDNFLNVPEYTALLFDELLGQIPFQGKFRGVGRISHKLQW